MCRRAVSSARCVTVTGSRDNVSVEPRKHCHLCGELKPLDDFYRAAGMRDGHRNDCKACNLAAKKKRYEADPQREIQRVRDWQLRNHDRHLAYQRERRQRPENKRRERDGHLRRKFGITIEQYEEMLAAQDGRCAICRSKARSDISLHVDHDHKSGRNRGLLCFRCNNVLGDLKDDPDRLLAALSYLDSHDPEQEELAERARERLRGLATTGR